MIDLLLFEQTVYHGQVLWPLLRDLDREGIRWRLILNAAHRDREYFERTFDAADNLIWFEPGSRFASLRCLLASVARWRPKVLWFLSPDSGMTIDLILGCVLARRTVLTIHSQTDFPSPRGFRESRKGRLGRWFFWGLVRPEEIVVLGREWERALPELFALYPKVKSSVYQPLTELSELEPHGREARIFLSGPLLSQIRDFTILEEALDLLPPGISLKLVVGGSGRRGGPNDGSLCERLRLDSRVEVVMKDWLDYEELNCLIAGCHYILQVPDRDKSRVYTSSIQMPRYGLPRPLLGVDERADLPYSGVEGLVERLGQCVKEVQDGTWVQRILDRKARRSDTERANRGFLRSLMS